MNKIVYVLTNPQHGWDCVIGGFAEREKALDKAIEDDIEKGQILSLTEKEELYDRSYKVITKVEVQ